MPVQHSHAVESTNLADLLERILDTGVVIAGDISIKLIEVELLTIQLRLVICSIDKAREIGLDWWNHDSRSAVLGVERKAALTAPEAEHKAALEALDRRLGRIEQALGTAGASEHKEPIS
jgi:hypothetical protein